ncbi:MAG: DUF6088 family protein [Clostridia bacterium]|nr:DUF6088 family protein [Clostridia bacterium]
MKHNYLEEIIYSRYKENQLIEASSLYLQLNNAVNEMAYYKALERMVQRKKLLKVSKGVYCIPASSPYGLLVPSQRQILNQLLSDEKGVVVGYSLFNSLNLTTQVSKNIDVYSTYFNAQTKNIGNINIHNYKLNYTPEYARTIEFLEVLAHYKEIQDINHNAFLLYCKNSASAYNENAVKEVLEKITYPKSTIAFLRNILAHYGVQNSLSQYLSPFSSYKYPSMEELYALA